MRSQARLIARDDQANLELYQIGQERLWVAGTGASGGVAYNLVEQQGNVYSLGLTTVKPGDVVIDAGANVGTYTRLALRNGASKVIAIEPAPGNIECLRRNLKEEIARGEVVLYPKGVWDKEDALEMYINPDNEEEDTFLKDGTKGVRQILPVTTIDIMARELRLDRVDFIKMDIEGSERRALVGAAETIKRFHPRMAICVYHLSDDPIAIPAAIRSASQDYVQECGPCITNHYTVIPRVFFYH